MLKPDEPCVWAGASQDLGDAPRDRTGNPAVGGGSADRVEADRGEGGRVLSGDAVAFQQRGSGAQLIGDEQRGRHQWVIVCGSDRCVRGGGGGHSHVH